MINCNDLKIYDHMKVTELFFPHIIEFMQVLRKIFVWGYES